MSSGPGQSRLVFLASAATAVAGLTALSKALGFIREMATAGVFGASASTDAYMVGLAGPVAIFGSVGVVLGTVFIPVFAGTLQTEGPRAADDLARTTMNAAFLLTTCLCFLGELVAGPLTRFAAPGLPSGALGQGVALTRIMLPVVVFQALGAVATGVLQTKGDFTTPLAAGLIQNVVLIGGILTLGPAVGIFAAGYAMTAGTGLQLLLLAWALRRSGFRWHPTLDWRDRRLARLAVLAAPVLAGLLVARVDVLADTVLASGLEEGSLSALTYAGRLALLPGGVFGSAISVVLFPDLSRLGACRDLPRMRGILSRGVRAALFMLTPMALGLLALREPVVNLAFQRGQFTPAAALATAYGLAFLCLGIVPRVVLEILTRASYALGNAVTPLLVTTGMTAASVGLKAVLVRPLGVGGLALSSSLSACLGVAGLIAVLRVQLRGVEGRRIWASAWRALLGGGVAAAAAAGLWRLSALWFPAPTLLSEGLRLAGSVATGIGGYAVMCLLLRPPEAGAMLSAFVRTLSGLLGIGPPGRAYIR